MAMAPSALRLKKSQKNFGWIDETIALAKELTSKLYAGNDCERFKATIDRLSDIVLRPHFFEEAQEAVEYERSQGRDIYLVTMSPQEMADAVAALLGFDGAIGSQSARAISADTGREYFTGEITFLGVGGYKAQAAQRVAKERGFDLSQSSAYSDCISDLPMLSLVGEGHVINPSPELLEKAQEHGWAAHEWSSVPDIKTRHVSTLRQTVRTRLNEDHTFRRNVKAAGLATVAVAGSYVAGTSVRRSSRQAAPDLPTLGLSA